jgi:Legionella pneumophila major outer membrane protein precursor
MYRGLIGQKYHAVDQKIRLIHGGQPWHAPVSSELHDSHLDTEGTPMQRICVFVSILLLPCSNLPLAAQTTNQTPAAPVPLGGPSVSVASAPTTNVSVMPTVNFGSIPCDPDNRSGLMAGGEFYYLKAFLPANTAYVTVTNPGQPNSSSTNTPFQWDFQPAFAGWIGYTLDCGFGVRGRYFQFDASAEQALVTNGTTPSTTPANAFFFQNTNQTTVNAPLANLLPLSTGGTAFGSPGTILTSPGLNSTLAGPDHLTFTSGLFIRAIDLEATFAFRFLNVDFLASGGGRYLQLNQNYQATLVNTGNGLPVHEYQQLSYARNFTGGGLTAALQGSYRFGNTGFSIFANGRTSVIAGQSTENESYLQTLVNPAGLILGVPALQTINPHASRSSDNVIPILEIELGVEYAVNLTPRTRLYFRTAGVSHTYFDAGNATSTSGNVSLFGFQGSIGLNY